MIKIYSIQRSAKLLCIYILIYVIKVLLLVVNSVVRNIRSKGIYYKVNKISYKSCNTLVIHLLEVPPNDQNQCSEAD